VACGEWITSIGCGVDIRTGYTVGMGTILSKALMLADDEVIADESILSQIRL